MLVYAMLGGVESEERSNPYGYSGGECLWVENMIWWVFGGFGVESLKEGFCKVELTHRGGNLIRFSGRSEDSEANDKGMPG